MIFYDPRARPNTLLASDLEKIKIIMPRAGRPRKMQRIYVINDRQWIGEASKGVFVTNHAVHRAYRSLRDELVNWRAQTISGTIEGLFSLGAISLEAFEAHKAQVVNNAQRYDHQENINELQRIMKLYKLKLTPTQRRMLPKVS